MKEELKDLTGYDYSRAWFDFCFSNPEKISPNHTAIFFFALEHRNRLGWKEKFGFPTQMAMDAIGIKKHQTYIKYFNEICEWGFFILVQKSSNQYSANIISLSNGKTKNGKALDKAFIKHGAKQTESNGQSTGQSNSPIDKQLTINNKPLTTTIDEVAEEKNFEAPLFVVPEEVPLDPKGLIKIYVAGIKILSVDDFAHKNWPSLCEILKMKLGKEIFIKKVAAFEERNADEKYLSDREMKRHFTNYMNKYIPEEHLGQIKETNDEDKHTTTATTFPNGNRETAKSSRDALEEQADAILRAV